MACDEGDKQTQARVAAVTLSNVAAYQCVALVCRFYQWLSINFDSFFVMFCLPSSEIW